MVRRDEALRTQVRERLAAWQVYAHDHALDQPLGDAAGDAPGHASGHAPGHAPAPAVDAAHGRAAAGDDRPATVKRRAAVAVVIADAGHGPGVAGLPVHEAWSDDAALVLTRRASGLRQHAGQWALPGGRIDEGESPEQAALRELHEEVGLRLGDDAVLGRLDDYVTRSGYAITPVVVWGGAVSELAANPAEVASIHRIPVAELLRADAPILNRIPHSRHPVLRMPVGSQWIAAPTAAILYQFREVCVLGRDTRVFHFEQPYFAWR